MSREHDSSHFEALFAILAAAEDPRPAFEASDLAACSECRLEVESLLAAGAELETVGRIERADLKALETAPKASGEDAAIEALRREIQASEALQRGASRRGWLAAAAVLLCFGLVWRGRRDGGSGFDPDEPLGAPLELLQPIGPRAEFSVFRWHGELPEGGYFIIRIEDEAFELLAKSERLGSNEWKYSDPSSLPDTIHWSVSVYDELDPRAPLDDASASASR